MLLVNILITYLIQIHVIQFLSDVNGLMWKWNVPCFKYYDYHTIDNEYNECRHLCPTDFNPKRRIVKIANVMLESQDCALIEMDILICICSRPDEVHDDTRIFDCVEVVRGVNGEAYKVSTPKWTSENMIDSNCNDSKSYIIKRCISDGTQWEFPRNLSEIEELFYNRRESK